MRRVNVDKAFARAKAKVEKMSVVERYTMFVELSSTLNDSAGYELIDSDMYGNGYIAEWFGVDDDGEYLAPSAQVS